MSILVLGAGGMAGSMIVSYLKSKDIPVIAMFRQDFDALKDDWPDISHFDYVINCIGLIKQKSSDDSLLFKLNSVFPYKLSTKCKRLIHISSDCVFSGIKLHGNYTINDRPDAKDSYGQSKAEGELSILKSPNVLILRTSIIGPAKDNAGLFEWFRNTKDNPIKGFSNHLWSGITTLELAKQIHIILQNNNFDIGLKQIASPAISKYLLLSQINEVFDLEKVIALYKSPESINRALYPDIVAKDIYLQLNDLKDFSCY